MNYFEEMESNRKLNEIKRRTFKFSALTYNELSTAEVNLSPLLLSNGYESFYHESIPVYLDVNDIESIIKLLEKTKKNILEGM